MFALPLRRAALLCALLLPALSSCSSKSVTQLRAQIHGWTGGAGRIEVLDDDLKTVVTTPLDTAGRFNLPLPTQAQLAGRLQSSLVPEPLPAQCSSTVKASRGAQYYMIGDLTAFPTEGQKTAYTVVSQVTGPNELLKRVLIFASGPVQVMGDLTCSGISASYRLRLKQGWNYAVSRQGKASTMIENAGGKDGFESWTVAQK